MPRKINIREEFYAVTVTRDPATGELLGERWELDLGPSNTPGHRLTALHREGGPACIWRDPESGVITLEAWYRNRRLHRADGPAEIIRDPKTGIAIRERWCQNGLLHRRDGPAAIYRNVQTGAITYRRWICDGQPMPRPFRPRRASQTTASSVELLPKVT